MPNQAAKHYSTVTFAKVHPIPKAMQCAFRLSGAIYGAQTKTNQMNSAMR